MKFSALYVGAALVSGLGLAATVAHAAPLPIVGGITSVQLNSAPTLTGLGLSVAPLGSAVASPGSNGIPLAYFPITGGSIDTGTFAGGIAHDGSGLKLSTASASISLTNFFINTATLQLVGDVSFGSTSLNDVPLFSLALSSVPSAPFSLNVTSQAAGALSAVFGVANLTGFTIGDANTIPITAAVPEPATVVSMLAGLSLMGLVLSRRRRSQA
jgi:hypothetical protein